MSAPGAERELPGFGQPQPLLALGKCRACGCCWMWPPEEWGKGFGYPGVVNYHRPVSVHWIAFVSQNNCESHKLKKFWTTRVGSRCEGRVSCRGFFWGTQMVVVAVNLLSLLPCTSSRKAIYWLASHPIFWQSHRIKKNQNCICNFAFGVLGASASICSQGQSWRQGGESGRWTFSVSYLGFPTPQRF